MSQILQLGDPRLYEKSDPIFNDEFPMIDFWVSKLRDEMQIIRNTYGFGRGIAAPQLGIMKRLIYIQIDKPLIIVNPEIISHSEETFELWDDCMCFPNLLVNVRRYAAIRVRYLNEYAEEQTLDAEGALSELLQHEIDHLEGILCTMRAIDNKSFRWRA